ncbi:MAG: cell division protein FtsX [Albidovulum sp.]
MNKSRLLSAARFLTGDTRSGRIVPPTGPAAWLTVLTAASMAFLAVFALSLSLAAGRVADRWSSALAHTATVRLSAPADQLEVQLQQVMDILAVTPGIASARPLERSEMHALLTPWFGADVSLDALPIPQLVAISETDDGFDAGGLRLRLSAEVPGAALDDHLRWQKPLAEAAGRIRLLGVVSLVLIGVTLGTMVTLAAQAALFANSQVIEVMRLVGARDVTIARAFVRRFTLRALGGSAFGMVAGLIAVALLPSAQVAGGFLTGLGFQGADWLWALAIPTFTAIVAFWATRAAALRSLKGVQ